MRNEYLSRTATFTAENIDKLFYEVGEEVVSRPDADITDTLALAAASRLMAEAVAHEVFGETTQKSVTLRGEDFAVRVKVATDRVGALAMKAHVDRKEDGEGLDRVMRVIGACSFLAALVEEKLFGSDHVEEHKSVNNEKEETNE